MLTSVHIGSYRRFVDFRLDSLRRVNLLVGPNGCGKTTIMEAIRLLHMGVTHDVLSDPLRRRGEGRRNAGGLNVFDYQHLFPNRSIDAGASIDVSGTESAGAAPRRVGVRAAKREELTEEEMKAISRFGVLIDERALRISQSGFGDVRRAIVCFAEDGARALSVVMEAGPPGRRANCTWFGPQAKVDAFTSLLWQQVVVAKRDGLVTDAMRIVAPDVARIAFLPGSSDETEAQLANVQVDVGGPSMVPLGSLGFGAQSVLSLAVGLAVEFGSAMFVDEIGHGVHHASFQPLWEMVVRTARSQEKQIFATTHSLDCVRGLADACEADPGLADEIAVHYVAPDGPAAVAFTGAEAVVAARQGIELRG